MKHHVFHLNGITLHAVERGEGSAVLFVHGFPDTWRGWRRQMEAVATNGYRAISLDMRGYGESSAPDDALVYTPFHTVGDLVALLDALEIATAVVVGHDFGATVAWNAALMRPDRFSAVFCLSVPFIQPGGPSFLEGLRKAGRHEFYMFEQMRKEADAAWADALVSIPGMLYWTSGLASDAQRWDPFDPARGLLRPSPVGIPDFADAGDVAAAIADFTRIGFHGPLNYYRAIDAFAENASAFAGATIRQPSFFMVGKADGMNRIREITAESLRLGLPGLRGFVAIDDVGHWPQLEATNLVNNALISFLGEVR